MKSRAILLAILSLAFCATSVSSAVSSSVVDQYTEQPPSPGGEGFNPNPGNQPNSGGGGAPAGGQSNGSPQPEVPAVQSAPVQPPVGRFVPAEPSSTEPANAANKKPKKHGKKKPVDKSKAEPEPEAEPVAAVVTESSSLGLGFPLVLLVISVAIVALAYARRRDSAQTLD